MKRLLLAFLVTFGIVASFVIGAAYFADGTRLGDPQNPEIVTGQIGDRPYFVPKDYMVLKGRTLSDTNIYVMAMFPQFAPRLESDQTLWEKGLWWQHINILAKHLDAPVTIDKVADGMIDLKKAFEVVGDEFGLIHQTQPKGFVQDHDDIWLAAATAGDAKYQLYILCGEQLTERTVPQCSMHFMKNTFHVQARFNKRLLPHWEKVRDGTEALLDSFTSRSAAIKFRNDAITNATH